MTIEPFHGDAMKIYKLKDGRYECDFISPNASILRTRWLERSCWASRALSAASGGSTPDVRRVLTNKAAMSSR